MTITSQIDISIFLLLWLHCHLKCFSYRSMTTIKTTEMITSNSSIMYKFLNKLIHCDTLFKQIQKTESLGLSPQTNFVYYITYTNKSTKQIYVKKKSTQKYNKKRKNPYRNKIYFKTPKVTKTQTCMANIAKQTTKKNLHGKSIQEDLYWPTSLTLVQSKSCYTIHK